ncbi:MAG: ATP-binding protein, partial [Thermodesulfobacteriota bacterium]
SNKKSGQMFTTEDINFIRTISNQVSISIENSFSFELVQGYANEVEEKNKQLKNVQAQLIQAEKMSAIGHLASGIAHEIRNPLNIIEGARYYLSSLFTDGSENVVAQEYLEYIQNEVVRTNRLIDSLLDFSKFQESNIENININNVIENVLILSRKQLSDNKIKIKKNLDDNLPILKGDSNQLWQVVINLLMNSVQAINSIPDMKGDGEIVVETGIYTKPDINYLDHLYLKVMDNGCGIKEKDLSSIFDPFYTNKPDGTGLGLSVSYKIVEAHSGSMLVTSEVGIGTSFMVELPVVNRFSGEVINEQKENLNS